MIKHNEDKVKAIVKIEKEYQDRNHVVAKDFAMNKKITLFEYRKKIKENDKWYTKQLKEISGRFL